MTIVVDVVRWQELVVPIIHFYAVRNGVFGRVSFVPLEDVQPPIVLGNKHRVERLLAAAGVASKDLLTRGNHALLDVPREDILQLLGFSPSLVPRNGKRKVSSTLVSVRVFSKLIAKLEGFQVVEDWWAANGVTSFTTATELMEAAGHVPMPTPPSPLPPMVRLMSSYLVHASSVFKAGRGERWHGRVHRYFAFRFCNRRQGVKKSSDPPHPSACCCCDPRRGRDWTMRLQIWKKMLLMVRSWKAQKKARLRVTCMR